MAWCRNSAAGQRHTDVKVNMNLILDVPAEFAEQIELLGIYQFDKCIYDQERKQISLSACTTFYRKGA